MCSYSRRVAFLCSVGIAWVFDMLPCMLSGYWFVIPFLCLFSLVRIFHRRRRYRRHRACCCLFATTCSVLCKKPPSNPITMHVVQSTWCVMSNYGGGVGGGWPFHQVHCVSPLNKLISGHCLLCYYGDHFSIIIIAFFPSLVRFLIEICGTSDFVRFRHEEPLQRLMRSAVQL